MSVFRFRHVPLFCFSIFLLVGCRAPKTAVIKEKTPVHSESSDILDLLEQKKHSFQTIKMRKTEVELTSNGTVERIKGNIAVYRDSMIVVSLVPVMGYEILRILCTKDSVIVINRPQKTYSAKSFDYYRMKYHIPVDFFDIQAVLTNEVFYYKDDVDERLFEKQLITRDGNSLFVVDSFREGQRITSQGIEIGEMEERLENIFVVDFDYGIRFNLNYEDFTDSQVGSFPQKVAIEILENANHIKLLLDYGQILFNDSINIEFAPPDQYTRGDI